MIFEELYNIVEARLAENKDNLTRRCKDLHSEFITDKRIREILEIEVPEVDNVSDIIDVGKGKVLAVRMDKCYGITGFKKPIIASLILKRLIEAVKRKEVNKNWIDGGNVNSSLALAYFANKFGGKAAYVMSRFFPEYMLDYINDISKGAIEIIKAPNLSLGVERDFYKYLVDLIRSDNNLKSYQPLWHAKYSGEYTQFLGKELAETLDFQPDYIVAIVGAGSTLEGQAMPIKTKFNNKPKIVVPEHEKSALLNINKPTFVIDSNRNESREYSDDWFSGPPKGIPHLVLGPHYSEINPLIKNEVLMSIDQVCIYSDTSWKRMSYECYKKGLEIGNSSAANLFVAKYLADQGHNVLTFIYEPFRSIYKGHVS
jgi:cysteine synthase